jgi:hypothetical protein
MSTPVLGARLYGKSLTAAPVTHAKNVGKTPTAIAIAADTRGLLIVNNGPVPIFWGGSTVTVDEGIPLAPGGSQFFGVTGGFSIYLIATLDGAMVRYAEVK